MPKIKQKNCVNYICKVSFKSLEMKNVQKITDRENIIECYKVSAYDFLILFIFLKSSFSQMKNWLLLKIELLSKDFEKLSTLIFEGKMVC